MVIERETPRNIFKALKLEEHCVYLVYVKASQNNIKHKSILYTGFKSGSYCVVYNNSYEEPLNMRDIYFLEVIEKLTKLKDE